ncbi:DUF805 domain-containing protein [Sphingomonas tabacisoli]|uniref:DUF805 domain-containing protein n=1 Tax=Sphingomonas tabacisoli TaxID=2249466 RepID=A0ABW4HY23_9SPHN
MRYNPLLFHGRVRRWVFLPTIFAINFLGRIADRAEPDSIGPISILSIAMIWPALTLSVQRAHDSGKSGWHVAAAWGFLIFGTAILLSGDLSDGLSALGWLGLLLAIAGGIISLVITFAAGDVGANRYGPNPRDDDDGALAEGTPQGRG